MEDALPLPLLKGEGDREAVEGFIPEEGLQNDGRVRLVKGEVTQLPKGACV